MPAMSRGQQLMLAASLACSAALVLHTFLAADGWPGRARARRDLATIEADIAAGQKRAAELRSAIEALRGRPDVQEHVIRDELGYVRRGDLVIDASAALR